MTSIARNEYAVTYRKRLRDPLTDCNQCIPQRKQIKYQSLLTDIDRPPFGLPDLLESIWVKDLRRSLYKLLGGRARLVNPPCLLIDEVSVGRKLDVVAHHVPFAWNVHKRAILGMKERPASAVRKVCLWIHVDDSPN